MASIFHKLVVFFFFLAYCSGHPLKNCKLDQIYQLGDSISDIGNLIREIPASATSALGRLPYGQTLFRYATGRASDGLLMIDYIAMAAEVAPLRPSLYKGYDYENGVNFAVAGATALPYHFLATQHIFPQYTNSSLHVQMDWMFNHFQSICLHPKDCVEKFQRGLFIIGQFGGNDYYYAITQGKTMEELTRLVPHVVASIMHAAMKLISMGATRLVIPGIFPSGCLPVYLTMFESNITSAFDQNQCLKQFNEHAKDHNQQLQRAILDFIKQKKPNATLIYWDIYNAYQFLLRVGKDQGFETQKACCRIGGKYNFDPNRRCGYNIVPVCEDPNRYVSWDGIHPTQQGNKIMVSWLLNNIVDKLHCYP